MARILHVSPGSAFDPPGAEDWLRLSLEPLRRVKSFGAAHGGEGLEKQ